MTISNIHESFIENQIFCFVPSLLNLHMTTAQQMISEWLQIKDTLLANGKNPGTNMHWLLVVSDQLLTPVIDASESKQIARCHQS